MKTGEKERVLRMMDDLVRNHTKPGNHAGIAAVSDSMAIIHEIAKQADRMEKEHREKVEQIVREEILNQLKHPYFWYRSVGLYTGFIAGAVFAWVFLTWM